MSIVKLVVVWKNQRPWKMEIDENKTILQLKIEIANHYKEKYIGFNILNGNDIIDKDQESKTIKDCGIKRLIRLPDNYEPGFSFNR